jgi:hypothetical protein
MFIYLYYYGAVLQCEQTTLSIGSVVNRALLNFSLQKYIEGLGKFSMLNLSGIILMGILYNKMKIISQLSFHLALF